MSSRRLTIATLCLLGVAACDSATHTLRIVSPTEPFDASIVEDIAELLADEATVRVVVTASTLAEEAALDAVESGEADLALVSNDLPFRSNIATVMPLYPTVLHIGSREGVGDASGTEILRGASIFAGPEGSASRHVFERLVERMGLGPDDYRYASGIDNETDIVIVFSPISPDIIVAIESLRDDFPEMELFSMGTPGSIGTGSLIDAAVLLNPHFQPFVIPVGTYGVLTAKPVVTIAVDKILVARSDLDSAVVYDLVNEILRLRPALAAKRPGLFQQLSDDFDTSRSTYVVHAGTQAYLQRSAPSVYERYSGVAEVAVTVIVGLGSALLAGIRVFRMRRKNRIDRFYTETIALKRSVDPSTSADEVQRVIEKVRGLQDTAFDLLVEEKLSADESFRIFITLSNDVLRQLGDADSLPRVAETDALPGR